jgi:hypothetical protein
MPWARRQAHRVLPTAQKLVKEGKDEEAGKMYADETLSVFKMRSLAHFAAASAVLSQCHEGTEGKSGERFTLGGANTPPRRIRLDCHRRIHQNVLNFLRGGRTAVTSAMRAEDLCAPLPS